MIIYQITNVINGKFYVGKTKQLQRRFYEHCRIAKNSTYYRHPLYDSIRSYGIENFKLDILEECDDFVADEREKYWISTLKPAYNLTSGGEGGDTFTNKPIHLQEQTRKRLSTASKIFNEKNRELHRTNTTKLWQTSSFRNRVVASMKKTAQNPEHRKLLSEKMREVALANRELWSSCKKGNKNGRWIGRVKVFNSSKELIGIYESSVEAAADLKIGKQTIRNKARTGESMTRGIYKGYTFSFERK